MRSWDDIDDLTDIYINQVVYPEEEEDYEDDGYSNTERREIIEMPRSIFITQLPREVFGDPTTKREFEALFPTAKDFAYFPSFSRIRVQFAESIDACRARVRFHLYDFHGARFRAYLTNHVDSNTEGTAAMDFLKPPKLEKQFLISPPPSPPEGWVQVREDKPSVLQPGIAFELMTRLAALKIGESYEIVEQTELHPAIILITCEDVDSTITMTQQRISDKPKMCQFQQTRRPEYSS